MKQKMLLGAVLLISTFMSLNAQMNDALVIRAGQTKSVSISDNMDVILMAADKNEDNVVVSPEAIEKLMVDMNKNTMNIAPRGYVAKGTRRTVFLYVNDLEKLVVGPNSTVRTVGVLNSENMKVYIDENVKAHVRVTGHVNAYPAEGVAIEINDIAKNRTTTKGF